MSGDSFFQNLLTLDTVLQASRYNDNLHRQEREFCTDLARYMEPFLSKFRLYFNVRERLRGWSQWPSSRRTRILTDTATLEPRIRNRRNVRSGPIPFRQFNHMVSDMMDDFLGQIRSRMTDNSESKRSDRTAEDSRAVLRHVIFRVAEHTDQDQKCCGICRDDFVDGEQVVCTSCCGTKFLHLNCAVQCLRQSDRCPFCRAGRVSFAREPAAATNE